MKIELLKDAGIPVVSRFSPREWFTEAKRKHSRRGGKVRYAAYVHCLLSLWPYIGNPPFQQLLTQTLPGELPEISPGIHVARAN